MKTEIDRMHAAIGIWMKKLDDLSGWKEWNRFKLRAALAVDDPWPGDEQDGPNEFLFPESISQEHSVVMAYLGLFVSLSSLRDCEYYFRRYPFRGLPVSHHDHLRYVCEMYFGRFYEFSERMKVTSDAVHAALAGEKVPFGQLIKEFGKHFKPELKERNSVHHFERFQDIRLDNIAIISMVASDEDERPYLRYRMRRSYREAAREWANRVRRRSNDVEVYLEAVATLILDRCAFLGELVQQNSKEATNRSDQL